MLNNSNSYQLINFKSTLSRALTYLNKNPNKCLVVIDNKNRLIGTLTDGDIRRAILNGAEFDDKIIKFVNKKPFYLKYKEKAKIKITKKIKNDYKIVPVIDNSRVVKNLIASNHNAEFKGHFNTQSIKPVNIPTVIMAGGLGKRLLPHTSVIPKPLLPIKGKSMIEHVIKSFQSYSLSNFYVTINYKSELLRTFFLNIKKRFKIKLINEKFPMGTAGSLSLIKRKIKKSFFVVNCDSLIQCDYISLYQFHKENKFSLTVVVSKKKNQIPYGVCKSNKKGHLINIDEKPQINFLANTGLYVVDPSILKLIPKDKSFDMNELIEKLFKKNKKIGVFPINETEWEDLSNWSTSN